MDLATEFVGLVDEKFATESKTGLITNKDYDFIGAHSIKIYSVGVAAMNDYGRNTDGTSRYGTVKDLETDIQEVSMEKDRSFTFSIDKMDEDETKGAVNVGTALARQIKEVVFPEVDTYTYKKIADNAGKTTIETITSSNAYNSIVAGTEYQDESEVPMDGRVLVCGPAFYSNLKKDSSAVLETEIGQDMRIKGVIANMDGVNIQKVPSKLLPTKTNFILSHPVATTQAIKLAEYRVFGVTPGVSGSLAEGRIYYTAFVRNNKKTAIYVSKESASL